MDRIEEIKKINDVRVSRTLECLFSAMTRERLESKKREILGVVSFLENKNKNGIYDQSIENYRAQLCVIGEKLKKK